MRKILVLLFYCVLVFSTDKDTLPLKDKTVPLKGGEPAESTLLSPKKSGGRKNPFIEAEKKPEQLVPYIAAVDTYGSTRIDEAKVRAVLGSDLDNWLKQVLQSDPAAAARIGKLTNRIKAKYSFAYVDFSIVQLLEEDKLPVYVTVDVVESKDVKERMPFLPEPTKDLGDPDSLLNEWMQYETQGIRLVQTDEIELDLEKPSSSYCPAFHCPYGHRHPKLSPYKKKFVDGVNKNEATLIRILKEERRPEYRASAAFLLAYMKDGKQLVALMAERIHDPDQKVRNNALRVLGEVADTHPEFIIPIRPIIEALNFPRVSDRNKAVFVLESLVYSSALVREQVLKEAIPNLLKIMVSKQPDQREGAHAILRTVSGKSYAVTDFSSWNNWYHKLPYRLPTDDSTKKSPDSK